MRKSHGNSHDPRLCDYVPYLAGHNRGRHQSRLYIETKQEGRKGGGHDTVVGYRAAHGDQ